MLTPEDFAFLETGNAGNPARTGFEEALLDEIGAALEDPDSKDLYRGLLERVERPLLEMVLARTDGNQIRAAAILGINRNTLRKKITDLTISLPARNHP